MKAISIKQPWAYAILHLGKDIENRTWRTNYRGPVLIHTGQKVDRAAVEALKAYDHDLPDTFETGGIVGQVEITDCIKPAQSGWYMLGHYGWILANAKPLPFVTMKGKLSFFETGIGETPHG